MSGTEQVLRPQALPEVERLRDPWSLPQLERATEPVTLRFFARPAVELARNLIGCVLLHQSVAGMIVETEAYLGEGDLAAHSSRGETERTRVIFGPPGRAYVYFIYGMHECLNVVAEREGVPGCVLIRALEPLCGLAEMQQRRRWHGPATISTAMDTAMVRSLSVGRWRSGRPTGLGQDDGLELVGGPEGCHEVVPVRG